jgi:hypothetical protein
MSSVPLSMTRLAAMLPAPASASLASWAMTLLPL